MSTQDPANLADDFPSPEPSNAHLPSMDMSSELANQALAQQVEQAAIAGSSSSTGPSPETAASSMSSRSLHDHHPEPTEHDPTDPNDPSHPTHPTDPHHPPDLDPSLEEEAHLSDPHQNHTHEHLQSSQYRRPHALSTGSLGYRPPESLSNNEQLVILREAYARNPNPGKRELEVLAEKTGRPWTKIREYFRQRRNKMRGLDSLEHMEEPGRASGWLQITYRSAPPTSHVSQLHLYNSYKTRFDPYSTHSPLLGGQELVQLACATFPGCEMAKSEDDYIIRGMKVKEDLSQGQASGGSDHLEKRVDDLVEPLRGATWLLSTFQHQPESDVTQTDLYASYAARFTDLPEPSSSAPQQPQGQAQSTADEAELREFEAEMAAPETESNGMDENDLQSFSLALKAREENGLPPPPPPPQPPSQGSRREERLLNPVELISLTRMTFPQAEPAVDDSGRFVIRGLERREGEEKGRSNMKLEEMFPFALASAPDPSDPNHPFTSLLKRKLALLHPDPASPPDPKRAKQARETLGEEEKELLEGLKRFKGSPLGREVRDICVNQ